MIMMNHTSETDTAYGTTDTNALPQNISPELSRAYSTAISLLPTQEEVEAVLIRAINSLAPDDLTASTLRNAVICELVNAQISRLGV